MSPRSAMRSLAALVGAAVATLGGGACQSDGTAESPEGALASAYGVPVVRGALAGEEATALSLAPGARVTWVLAWDLDGTTRDEDGSLTLTNDLGFHLRLAALHLATVSVEAVPCAAEASLGGPLRRLLAPRIALADHAYDHDESLLTRVVVESAVMGESQSYGTSFATGGTYCSVFGLSMPVAEAAADGAWLLGQSITLSGTWTPPEGGRETPFEASLPLSQGATSALSSTGLGGDAGPLDEVTITLTRSLRGAFDGLTPGELSPVDLADQVLRNVLQSTTAVASRP